MIQMVFLDILKYRLDKLQYKLLLHKT